MKVGGLVGEWVSGWVGARARFSLCVCVCSRASLALSLSLSLFLSVSLLLKVSLSGWLKEGTHRSRAPDSIYRCGARSLVLGAWDFRGIAGSLNLCLRRGSIQFHQLFEMLLGGLRGVFIVFAKAQLCGRRNKLCILRFPLRPTSTRVPSKTTSRTTPTHARTQASR